jgi:hypothetical protein
MEENVVRVDSNNLSQITVQELKIYQYIYCYQWITIFLHSNCKARAFARALQFANLTIDCNPLVAEGEYVSPISKACKVSLNFSVIFE